MHAMLMSNLSAFMVESGKALRRKVTVGFEFQLVGRTGSRLLHQPKGDEFDAWGKMIIME